VIRASGGGKTQVSSKRSASLSRRARAHRDCLPEAEQRRDLLEIVEDRYDARSILITSQLPVSQWYEIIGYFIWSKY